MIDFIVSYWWFLLILIGMYFWNGFFVVSVIKSFGKDKIKTEIKKSPAYIMIMMMSVNGLLTAILIALLMIHSKLGS
tara:strand:+ start:153 stop:383 length:231 start_codon:yes stop_codon:yes gene_type:complete